MLATRIFSPASQSVSPSTTQLVPPPMWHVPKAGADRVGGQTRRVEPSRPERRASQSRRAPQGREPRPARRLAPGLRPEAQHIAARQAGTPAHDLTASGPAPILQPLFTHRARYSRHAGGSLLKRRGAATSCERVFLATAARRHANVTVAQQSSNPVALRSAHGRAWLDRSAARDHRGGHPHDRCPAFVRNLANLLWQLGG